jgi:hypothetical protein
MPQRFIVPIAVIAFSALAMPAFAQQVSAPAGPAAGGTITTQPSSIWRTVRFDVAPERTSFATAAWLGPRVARTAQAPQTAPKRKSTIPIVGGLVAGAVLGFFAGNYIQHSACEYDCGAGGFTWGFTAIGAGGGAAIGWALSR